MASPLAQHAVKAQADEEGDEGQDHDYGQASGFQFFKIFANIMRDE